MVMCVSSFWSLNADQLDDEYYSSKYIVGETCIVKIPLLYKAMNCGSYSCTLDQSQNKHFSRYAFMRNVLHT